MFGVLISIFLLYLDFASREYSHQTVKQWLRQTVKMATSPLSASAAATFREKAGPVQLFSASSRSLRAHSRQRHSAATFAVSASAKAESRSIFAECRGVAAADATFSAPNGIVCGRLKGRFAPNVNMSGAERNGDWNRENALVCLSSSPFLSWF